MLIKNALIVTMDSNKRVMRGDILIEGNKIIKVDKKIEAKDEIIDANGMVALPGFINTHTHSAMTLLRGYADDLPLMKWLKEYIWPLEALLKPEDCYIGSKLACLEMIKAGITTFSDMYFYMNDVAKAVEESGIRGILSYVINDLMPENFTGLTVTKRFLNQVKKSERIIPIIGPHSPYACSKETLLKAKELAEEYKTLIHIHASETKEEIEESKKKFGLRPIEYLNSIGFLDSNVEIAHCVWVDNYEIKILAKNKVKISHCSVSNMKLSSGISPVNYMIENGLITSLGSDGPCSNNRLDIIQEMKFCSLLQKVSFFDPTAVNAEKALEMATINGARALGLEEKIGSIEEGKLADIILLDFKKPHLTPLHNIYSHLVYAAQSSDVDTVICNGKILMKNRKVLTIDENETMEKAELAKKDLLERK
ncbi:MAG: amidohydrolase [Candidatus Aenigmatarchaeota archaeon]